MGMLKLIRRNFFRKAPTRLYPLIPERDPFERTRGRIELQPENCILCGICSRKCPADAITVDRAAGKWELNATRCIICGECVNSCPRKTIKMSNERRHSMSEKQIVYHHVEPPKPAARPAAPKPAAPKPVQPVQPNQANEAK